MNEKEINIIIGRALKKLRHELNLSQSAIAKPLGISFQQIRKYEHGIDRVSAARLWAIAQITKKPISFFFKEIEDVTIH